MIPLSLYIHIPWCVEKCPYCDFNSHKKSQDLPVDNFINALITDLESQLALFWGRPVQSIFIGGGTPSILSPDHIGRILELVRARLPITAGAEVTMEANPGSVEHGLFKDYRSAGINRLSLGVQSFNDKYLKKLGRIHTALEAVRAIESIADAGFNSFNIDLMFALPGQNINDAMSDLNLALNMNPQHLSWYQLTIEPNTAFYNRPPALPEGDLVADMQMAGQRALSEAGLVQYEVSAYASATDRCQHNLNYWHFGDYIGIGPGAHGKRTDFANRKLYRSQQKRQPESYIQHYVNASPLDTTVSWHPVSKDAIPFEFMLNALRLIEGVNTSLFSDRTFVPLESISHTLNKLADDGLIDPDWVRQLKTTAKGSAFLNDVTAAFL